VLIIEDLVIGGNSLGSKQWDMRFFEGFLTLFFLVSPLKLCVDSRICKITGFDSQAMIPSSQMGVYIALQERKIGPLIRYEGLALAGDTCNWKGDSILLDYVTVLYYDSLNIYTISYLQFLKNGDNGNKEYKAIWTDSLNTSLGKFEVSKTFYLQQYDRLLVTQNPGTIKAKYWSHYPVFKGLK